MTLHNNGSSNAQVHIHLAVLDESGAAIGTTETDASVPRGGAVFRQFQLKLSNIMAWTLDRPTLYYAVFNISSGSLPPQTVELHFGVRTISFDAHNGFQLNGQSLKMQGGCVHHDNGPLGSAAVDRADERRVEQLKSVGYNAIRTSHNPVSPAFLDACDRLGMLVMEEAFDCWEQGKKPDDYHNYFDEWWQRDMEVGRGVDVNVDVCLCGGATDARAGWRFGTFSLRMSLFHPNSSQARPIASPPLPPHRPWCFATGIVRPLSCGPSAMRSPCDPRPRACSCRTSFRPTCAHLIPTRAALSPRPCLA